MEELGIRTSIRSLYARIINTFTKLIQEFENSKSRSAEELTLDDLEDVRGRLRLWAGNSGAHRTGRVSLDYKLRYSSQVHDKVTEYLEALDNTLRSGTCCVSCLSPAKHDSQLFRLSKMAAQFPHTRPRHPLPRNHPPMTNRYRLRKACLLQPLCNTQSKKSRFA